MLTGSLITAVVKILSDFKDKQAVVPHFRDNKRVTSYCIHIIDVDEGIDEPH